MYRTLDTLQSPCEIDFQRPGTMLDPDPDPGTEEGQWDGEREKTPA